MNTYTVKPGDSPSSIAFDNDGSLQSLLDANKHKPVALINGVVTFQTLYIGETLNVPTHWPCNGRNICGGGCAGQCSCKGKKKCSGGCGGGGCYCPGANNSTDYGGIRGGCGGCSSYPGNPPSSGSPPGTFPGIPGGSPGSMPTPGSPGGGGNPGGGPGGGGHWAPLPPGGGASGGGNPGGHGGPGGGPGGGGPGGGASGGGNPGGSNGGGASGGGNNSGGGGGASGGGNDTGGGSSGGVDTPPAVPPPSGGGNNVDQPPPAPISPVSPGGPGTPPIIPKYSYYNLGRHNGSGSMSGFPGLGDSTGATTDPTTGVVTLPTTTIVGDAGTPTWVMPTVVAALSAAAGFGLAYVVMRPAKSVHQIAREEFTRSNPIQLGSKIAGRTVEKIENHMGKSYVYLSGTVKSGLPNLPITDGKTVYMIQGHAFTNTPPGRG